MLAGELYHADSPELTADNMRACSWMKRYNEAINLPQAEREEMLMELFGFVGQGVNIRPPFYCDYGYNIKVGSGVFMNYNCIILDVAEVSIGDMTQIGPNVQILAADHPRDPELRSKGFELGRPVKIGKNVWIGAGAIIVPGITVGDNALIGAGSIITKDVPEGATVVGNPGKIR